MNVIECSHEKRTWPEVLFTLQNCKLRSTCATQTFPCNSKEIFCPFRFADLFCAVLPLLICQIKCFHLYRRIRLSRSTAAAAAAAVFDAFTIIHCTPSYGPFKTNCSTRSTQSEFSTLYFYFRHRFLCFLLS